MPGQEQQVKELSFKFNEVDQHLIIENGTFDSFTALNTLSLTFQRLTNISDGILTKTLGARLLTLTLSYNLFPKLSSIGFTYMKQLTHLNLDHNSRINYSLLENNFPRSLSNLEYLNLDGCKIKNFHSATFMHLK